MDNKKKYALTLLATLAVMAYTIWNYVTGKTDQLLFLVSMVALCVPLLNMANLLIQEWKKK